MEAGDVIQFWDFRELEWVAARVIRHEASTITYRRIDCKLDDALFDRLSKINPVNTIDVVCCRPYIPSQVLYDHTRGTDHGPRFRRDLRPVGRAADLRH